MEHLETFEKACEVMGYDPKEVLPITDKMPAPLAKAVTAVTKLFVLSEASWKAEGKVIDWYNDDQYKYYPWWDMDAGFSFGDYFWGGSASTVSSRLVFPSSDAVEYVTKQHYPLYRDMMVIEKLKQQ